MPVHPTLVSVRLKPVKRLNKAGETPERPLSREPARQALRTAHRGLTDVTRMVHATEFRLGLKRA